MSQLNPSYDSLALFIPLHNEAANVFGVGQHTLEVLGDMGIESQLILVDDGSTDQTASEIERLQHASSGSIAVVAHPRNQGYGAALRTGFKKGLETGMDLVGLMDGDDQFDPNDIPRLVEKIAGDKTDGIVGIRSDRSDRLYRQWLGHGWQHISSAVLDCGLVDVDCGLKIFRSEPLSQVTPNLISKRGAAISPEVVARLKANGATLSETEVTHRPRVHGKSSGGKPDEVVGSLIDLVRVRRDLSSNHSTAAGQPV